jgi:hypothetical protein
MKHKKKTLKALIKEMKNIRKSIVLPADFLAETLQIRRK